MADDLFVNLHMLSAAPISVCRRHVLEQALKTLGISMHESIDFDDQTNEILATTGLIVPYNIHMPRLRTRLFHGYWCLTSDAAVQSACYNTLVYLQKVKMLIIDGIHSAELKRCQRELLQAKSWAEVFDDHAKKLQDKLSAVEYSNNEPLDPSGSSIKLEDNVKQGTMSGLPLGLLTEDSGLSVFEAVPLRKRINSTTSENVSVVVDDLSYELDCVRQDIYPECTLSSTKTPTSVNKPTTLRTRDISHDSKVRKPLFLSTEDKGKAIELEDNVLEDPKRFAIMNKVHKDTIFDLDSRIGETHPLEKEDP